MYTRHKSIKTWGNIKFIKYNKKFYDELYTNDKRFEIFINKFAKIIGYNLKNIENNKKNKIHTWNKIAS